MIRVLHLFVLLIIVGFKASAQAPNHVMSWNEVLVQSALDFHSGDQYGFSVSVHDLFTAIGAPSQDFSSEQRPSRTP